MKKKVTSRSAFMLSSVSIAVLTLVNQVQAEEIQKVEVTGSSIRRLATEASLPVTMVTGEELE